MTGVEGYVESAASGLLAGINAARLAKGEEPIEFPRETTFRKYGLLYYTCRRQTFPTNECKLWAFPRVT